MTTKTDECGYCQGTGQVWSILEETMVWCPVCHEDEEPVYLCGAPHGVALTFVILGVVAFFVSFF